MKFSFSCLIPIYYKDNPEHLKLALESIAKQILIPDEVIIVQDGPLTPALDKVVIDFINEYDKIHTIVEQLKENVGMGMAMNIGLHLCRFDWVARMDSDDIAKPDRFSKQVQFLQKNPDVDVLGGNISEFNKTPNDTGRLKIMPKSHEHIVKFMRYRNPINHMTVMFKKSLAVDSGGYWLKRYFEDYNLWFEMYKNGAIFANLTDILVDVRITNMESRRSGFSYFLIEATLFRKMLKSGFIGIFQFYFSMPLRLFARIIPVFFLRSLYKNFFRN
jgi:glycosyltransferase involved in cell wall biosynthesis